MCFKTLLFKADQLSCMNSVFLFCICSLLNKPTAPLEERHTPHGGSEKRKKIEKQLFDVAMPGGHRDVADCQNRFWPEMSARREHELLRLLTEDGTEPMRRLWLRHFRKRSRCPGFIMPFAPRGKEDRTASFGRHGCSFSLAAPKLNK